jgi:hypothetical protein
MKVRLQNCAVVKDRKTQLKVAREAAIKQRKREMYMREKEYAKKLAEINTNVLKRPLLVEQASYGV